MTLKMLIVDDASVIRQRIARVLSSPRLEHMMVVGVAGDGVSAVSLAHKEQPDIITMDLTMPNMDGHEAIGRIAAIAPGVRILVVSALADKLVALKAIKQGAQGFLHKPFTDEALIDALVEISA